MLAATYRRLRCRITYFCALIEALLLAAVCTSAQAQEAYFSTTFGELYSIPFSDVCTPELVGIVSDPTFGFEVGFPDIAFGPDGFLYGVSVNQLLRIDPQTAAATLVGTDPLLAGINSFCLLPSGEMLGINGNGQLLTIALSPLVITVLGPTPVPPSGDLSVIDGEVYLSAATNELWYIDLDNLANSTAVVTLTTTNNFGLFSFYSSCSTQELYVLHDNMLTHTDFASGAALNTCELIPASEFNFILGAASFFEIESVTCALVLDLDGDNSSGAALYDYYSGPHCGPGIYELSDADATFSSTDEIDSLVVQPSGFLDGAAEQLLFPSASGLALQAYTDGSYTLITAGWSADAWLDLIAAITYQHDAAPFTAGTRTVSFTPYIDTLAGVSATASFFIGPELNYSEGISLSSCAFEELNLDSLAQLPADAQGLWLNPLGDTLTTGLAVQAGVYSYVASAASPCVVPFEVNLIALPVPELDAVLAQPDCLSGGCTGSIEVELLADETFYFEGAEAAALQDSLCSGSYALRVVNTAGCSRTDTVQLAALNQNAVVSLPAPDTRCIEAFPFYYQLPPDYDSFTLSIGGQSYSDSVPLPAAGTYSIAMSSNACLLQGQVSAGVFPDRDALVSIYLCKGSTAQLLPPYLKPGTAEWSTGATTNAVTASSYGSFEASYTSLEGCSTTAIFDVLPKGADTLLVLPNVISPNGDGRNDSWQPSAGSDVQLRELVVYDRWGIEQYRGEPAGWELTDGVHTGTYLVVQRYRTTCLPTLNSVTTWLEVLR